MYSVPRGVFSIEQVPVPHGSGDNVFLYSVMVFAAQEVFVGFRRESTIVISPGFFSQVEFTISPWSIPTLQSCLEKHATAPNFNLGISSAPGEAMTISLSNPYTLFTEANPFSFR